MDVLLVAINAKYIHSNLGVYSLKAYAMQQLAKINVAGEKQKEKLMIEIAEYTINHQKESILKDIYKRKPHVLAFSCYIWNIEYTLDLIADLHKILPKTDIWLGGPEVSFDAGKLLEAQSEVLGVMRGEGEEIFSQLLNCYRNLPKESPKQADSYDALEGIEGLTFRSSDGNIIETPSAVLLDMSKIPFSYSELAEFTNRIIYYESSRGCPFSCSYCLSSIDKTVRFRNIELVLKELDFFLEHRVAQVKFVDRTFNCKKPHAIAIWQHILKHDNGVTNFHFEISADLLDEEALDLLRRMRVGLIQLEIGVQSTNASTLASIQRTMDLNRLREATMRINSFGNIHQHLDLIAGLPEEDYESFHRSFNEVYAMQPANLQLGFLKVLKGSYMAERNREYKLLFTEKPPYEVLSTAWLSYEELLRLKGCEEMIEVYYNSNQFATTMPALTEETNDAFVLFERLANYYEEQHLFDANHSRMARYEILDRFITQHYPEKTEQYRDGLIYDLYLRDNVKSRPHFARDQSEYKQWIRDFFIKETKEPKYLIGYELYDSRQVSNMAHIEVLADGRAILFDYKNRNPLTHNAKATVVKTLE